MSVGDAITFIYENWDTILNLGTQIVGVAAIIATLTPNRADDKYVQMIFDFVNFMGFNFGKAANRG